MKITPLDQKDYPMLAGIDSAWGVQSLTAIAASPAACGMGARDETAGNFIGYIIGHAHKHGGEAEIVHLAVAAAHRRKGIGRDLLAAFIKSHAKTACHLEVAEDNLAAIALYNSAGFRAVGRREGYYPRDGGMRVDALRMRLDTYKSGL